MICTFVFSLPAHAASSVVINEIQTGGIQDADDEFIELWNGSDAAISLEEWSLQYKTATGTTINKRNFEKGATIPAQGYYLIATKEYTGGIPADLTQATISLAKSGGNLFLVRNQEVVTGKDDLDIVDRVSWGTGDSAEGNAAVAPEAGQSIARTDGNDTNNNAKDFVIRVTPTPANAKNTNSPATNAALPPPSPATEKTTSEQSEKKESATTRTRTKEGVKEEKGTLSITEVLPNPVGSDEREFIELQNTGSTALTLADWRITNRLDQEYLLRDGTLAPKEYRVLWREKSRLALQNDREEIRLFAPDKDRAIEIIKYTNAAEGASLMRDANDDLVWTTNPTPGEVNRLVGERAAPHAILHAPKEGTVGALLALDASDSFDPQGDALTFSWNFGDGLGTAEGAQATYIYLKPGAFPLTLTVADKEGLTTVETQKIKISGKDLLTEKKEEVSLRGSASDRNNLTTRSTNREIATLLTSPADRPSIARNKKKTLVSGTIRGVVTVPPGVLAKTYMYIACETPCAGEGIKVRMTKAGWPELKKGDVITINGKMTTTGDEPSFLTRREWVRVLGTRKQITGKIAPSLRTLDDTLLQQLITVSGEVTDKKNRLLYLDDGGIEIPVQVKSSTQFIAEGDKVTVTGILKKDQKGYRLQASELITLIDAAPRTKTNELIRIVRDKDNERLKYLAMTLAALLAIAAKPTWDFAQRRLKKTADADQPKGDQVV